VLKPWAELGFPAYSGAARYRREFTLPRERLAGTRRLFLECGELRYTGRAWLNGVDLGNRAWRPFRWEITTALKPGANVIEIEVRNTPAAAFAGDPASNSRRRPRVATSPPPSRSTRRCCSRDCSGRCGFWLWAERPRGANRKGR
jgi:hypothetical protein